MAPAAIRRLVRPPTNHAFALFTCVAASMLAVTGCGGDKPDRNGAKPPGQAQTGAAMHNGSPSSRDGPDWERGALPGAIEIARPSDAQLAFVPIVPSKLGAPLRIVATPSREAPAAYREIAFVYRHATYGVFVIKERLVPSRAATRESETLAAQEPGCTTRPAPPELQEALGTGPNGVIRECHNGRRSRVAVRNGARGFLVETSVVTGLRWLEPLRPANLEALASFRERFGNPSLDLAVEVVVIGPSDELTGGEAVEIATKF